MVRTVISLDRQVKGWLDRKAAKDGVSMAAIIRMAVSRLREEERACREFDAMLKATSGIGNGEDGLKVQERLRNEWKRRSA